MAQLIQKTKLFLPTARATLVDRPRLLGMLDRLHAAGCRVMLVSAPAGSGKTTLFSQWLSRTGWAVAWLSLDARDNLPARFFTYLIAALQNIAPETGRQALALLDLPGANFEEVITLLTNDLVDIPRPFVLALDDYHTITHPQIHQAVDRLIEAQPPQMRLVLLSREDPPLPMARRRARGQLIEVRQEDLRFSPQGRPRRFFSRAWRSIFPASRWICWKRARKAGSPGCKWQRSPCSAPRMSSASCKTFPAVTVSSWITCWKKCWRIKRFPMGWQRQWLKLTTHFNKLFKEIYPSVEILLIYGFYTFGRKE